MKSIIRGATVLLLAVAPWPAAAQSSANPVGHVLALREPAATAAQPEADRAAKKSHPFAALAGTWTGGGTISLTNDINERLRCRAQHRFSAANNGLSLSIRCASDNYKFELSSDVTERGGRISGQWREASYNVSGSLNGRLAGNRITATASGDTFTTALSVVTSGNRQTVQITPEKTYIISVKIALARR
jgi:hypothetical protein